MADYRLSDEVSIAPKSKPPWNPSGLFFLVWICAVFGGVVGPLMAVFSVWNWKRLGHPKKFRQSAAVVAIVFLIPFALTELRFRAGFPDRDLSRTICFACYFLMAYWFLFGQKNLYQSHLQNNGKAASLILPCLSGVLLVAALWVWIALKRAAT